MSSVIATGPAAAAEVGRIERILSESSSVRTLVEQLSALETSADLAAAIVGATVQPPADAEAAKVWTALCEALVRKGDAVAGPILVAVLRTGNREARSAAALSLGRVRTPEAASALETALRDPEPAVVTAARHALVAPGQPLRPAVALTVSAPGTALGRRLRLGRRRRRN